MSATGMNWPAVTATPLSVSVPAAGSVRDLHRQQVVGRRVVRIAEAEVGGRERVGRVLQRGDRLVGARRGVVDRGDIDRDRVGRRIEIDAAVGRAAVVLHLEGEAGVGRAVGVGRRRELQQAGRDVGHGDELAGGHGHAVVRRALPAAGSVVIFTASRLLAGVSFGSLKPKSAAVNV